MEDEEIRIAILGEYSKEDVCFQNAIFAQCFLPIKPLPKGTMRYQTDHGNASIVLNVGELKLSDKNHIWETREIPSGMLGRLIFIHINNEAIRTNNREIDLGSNIHQFISKYKLSTGGKMYKNVAEQLKNVCACLINVGIFDDKKVEQSKVLVSSNVRMFLENDLEKGKFWNRTFVLSQDYFDVLMKHKVPLSTPAILALAKKPRALDLFMWLSYRLRTLEKPVFIPYSGLLPIFGNGFTGDQGLKNFTIAFNKSLKHVHKYYPDAVVAPQEKGLIIHPSPSPVCSEGVIIEKKYYIVDKPA